MFRLPISEEPRAIVLNELVKAEASTIDAVFADELLTAMLQIGSVNLPPVVEIAEARTSSLITAPPKLTRLAKVDTRRARWLLVHLNK